MNDEDLAIAIQEAGESIKETSTFKCKHCSQIIVRTMVGRYPNGRDKRWVDTNGETCGFVCSVCHREKMALNLKLKRNRKHNLSSYNKE